ncbi:MAG: 50S ribosomal protein L11 methyltransferase, partial [Fusobacteriaceae bacterium]
LMVAGAKLGAKRVVGVDIDELAVEVAHENLVLNDVAEEKFEVHKGDLITTLKDEKFDVVVANILADVLLILMQDISYVAKKGGIIILSGIVDEKENLVKNEIERLGYKILEIKSDKEWRGMLVQA